MIVIALHIVPSETRLHNMSNYDDSIRISQCSACSEYYQLVLAPAAVILTVSLVSRHFHSPNHHPADWDDVGAAAADASLAEAALSAAASATLCLAVYQLLIMPCPHMAEVTSLTGYR